MINAFGDIKFLEITAGLHIKGGLDVAVDLNVAAGLNSVAGMEFATRGCKGTIQIPICIDHFTIGQVLAAGLEFAVGLENVSGKAGLVTLYYLKCKNGYRLD